MKWQAHLIQPTFITEYPAEVVRWRIMILAKSPTVLNSSSVVVLASNGFSRLNDAEDQAERFREQVNASKLQ